MQKHGITLILFGGTGDLARKKIIPALFELHKRRLLPKGFRVILFLRRDWDRNEFESFIMSTLPKTSGKGAKEIKAFLSRLELFRGDLESRSSFVKLSKYLSTKSSKQTAKLFYLSVSPLLYQKAIKLLKMAKLVSPLDKVLVEKPFGRNSKESKDIMKLLRSFVSLKQVLHIDHYLAKDAMDDIARSALPQSSTIAKIEAKIVEKGTIGERGAFYDALGALLDVGQNHLLQMIAALIIKLLKYKGSAHKKRARALKTIRVMGEELVRAQYEGYRLENGVEERSERETYFKAMLQSIDKKLQGVSLAIEAGKGFDKSVSEVRIIARGKPVRFDFAKIKKGALSPYAKMLHCAIRGENSIFVSEEEMREEWRVAEEISSMWRDTPLKMYAMGAKSITTKNN